MIKIALIDNNLANLLNRVDGPRYDRAQIAPGIVHLGIGGFHRAHMARYTHELMGQDFAGGKDWGIVGIGLMPGDSRIRDALSPQNGLYTLLEREGTREKAAIIASVLRVRFAGDGIDNVLNEIAASSVKIVSLTVTENGYCLHPVDKTLDAANPAIKHDVANPQSPVSAIGVIVKAYRRRRDSGAPPFTALSCDNIQNNGQVLKGAVLGLARLQEPELAVWIEKNASFPNTMVDRITPVTTPDDIAYVKRKFGIVDQAPVVSEAFTQWVIEDKFVAGRPDWAKVGAQFVQDVTPYEEMKLRLLNGSHLAIACLGDVAGKTYIDETIREPRFRSFMTNLMDRESGPTLQPVPGIDLADYKATLVKRFGNSAIKDTVARVATDAPLSTVLAPLSERLHADQSVNLLSLALAGWMRRMRGGVNELGREIVIKHPMAAQLQAKAAEGGTDPRALLSVKEIFGDLGRDELLVRPLQAHLTSLYEKGVMATLAEAAKPARPAPTGRRQRGETPALTPSKGT